MLYKPNYCCHCGEKVERIAWKPWTSRRFCENCQIAFQKEEWIPKIGVLVALIGGVLGFGSYLKTPEKPLNIAKNDVLSISSEKARSEKKIEQTASSNVADRSVIQPVPTNSTKQVEIKTVTPVRPAGSAAKETLIENEQNKHAESVYFCGSATKKGTPCTRKVKGGGRCWQHTGLPAVLPNEKLAAGQ